MRVVLDVKYTVYAPGFAGKVVSVQGAQAEAVREGDFVKVCVPFEGENAQVVLA
ncbi:MAG: hypothetical protein Q4A66_02620 [Eubacteriales bacterium]|nr:hypothetical protein [Eubacteriales bacterium]